MIVVNLGFVKHDKFDTKSIILHQNVIAGDRSYFNRSEGSLALISDHR